MKFKHNKRGTTYEVLGQSILQTEVPLTDGSLLVTYRGEDGKLWCRPYSEFHDGRFTEVKD